MGKMNVAYLRVSTEAQTEKYGLDVQKQKILDFCQKNNVEIDRWYIDGGYSGSKLDRPEIQKLLDDAEAGLIGTVYIYKLDRMSRDVIDTLNLIYRVLPKYDVQVVSMVEDIKTENPMDKVMVTMNAAMNQYEREVIRMRMSAGMVERVKKGLWPGGGNKPIGYYYDRNDGILHPHPEQAEMVREAYRMFIDGYSCDNIAKILGFKGDKVVRQILERKSNIGLIEYKGETYKGLHEPIIDEGTFYRAQECLKKRCSNSFINHDNLLTGLCWCGVCGARMRYQKWGKYHKLVCYSKGKNGKEYMQRDPNCDNINPLAADIEAYVEAGFKEFALSRKGSQQPESRAAAVEESIKKANTKIKKYYALYADNDNDNLLELIKEEENRVKALKAELLMERERDRRADARSIDRIKAAADVWDGMTTKDKNAALKEYVERVTITRGRVEISFATI